MPSDSLTYPGGVVPGSYPGPPVPVKAKGRIVSTSLIFLTPWLGHRIIKSSVLSQRFINIFQGPRGAAETLRHPQSPDRYPAAGSGMEATVL